MVLRKKQFDNSVRFVPTSEKRTKRDIEPKTKTIKAGSLLHKQNKNNSEIGKNSLKM